MIIEIALSWSKSVKNKAISCLAPTFANHQNAECTQIPNFARRSFLIKGISEAETLAVRGKRNAYLFHSSLPLLRIEAARIQLQII